MPTHREGTSVFLRADRWQTKGKARLWSCRATGLESPPCSHCSHPDIHKSATQQSHMMCSVPQALSSCLLSCLCPPLPERSRALSVSGQPSRERGPAGCSHSHAELLQPSSAATQGLLQPPKALEMPRFAAPELSPCWECPALCRH